MKLFRIPNAEKIGNFILTVITAFVSTFLMQSCMNLWSLTRRELHAYQIENADADACGYGRNPKSHRHKLQKDEHTDYNQKKAGAAANK